MMVDLPSFVILEVVCQIGSPIALPCSNQVPVVE